MRDATSGSMLSNAAKACVVLGIASAAVVASCRDKREPVGEASITSGAFDVLTTDVATDELTHVRCQRETACAPRDDTGKTPPIEVCTRHISTAYALELDPSTTCPRGVDRRSLERCLVAMRDAPCESAGELAGMVACRASEICLPIQGP